MDFSRMENFAVDVFQPPSDTLPDIFRETGCYQRGYVMDIKNGQFLVDFFRTGNSATDYFPLERLFLPERAVETEFFTSECLLQTFDNVEVLWRESENDALTWYPGTVLYADHDRQKMILWVVVEYQMECKRILSVDSCDGWRSVGHDRKLVPSDCFTAHSMEIPDEEIVEAMEKDRADENGRCEGPKKNIKSTFRWKFHSILPSTKIISTNKNVVNFLYKQSEELGISMAQKYLLDKWKTHQVYVPRDVPIFWHGQSLPKALCRRMSHGIVADRQVSKATIEGLMDRLSFHRGSIINPHHVQRTVIVDLAGLENHFQIAHAMLSSFNPTMRNLVLTDSDHSSAPCGRMQLCGAENEDFNLLRPLSEYLLFRGMAPLRSIVLDSLGPLELSLANPIEPNKAAQSISIIKCTFAYRYRARVHDSDIGYSGPSVPVDCARIELMDGNSLAANLLKLMDQSCGQPDLSERNELQKTLRSIDRGNLKSGGELDALTVWKEVKDRETPNTTLSAVDVAKLRPYTVFALQTSLEGEYED